MALNESQITALADLVGEEYDDTKDAVAELANYTADERAAIEAAIIADLAVWATVRDKHLRVSGGRDGVDLDYGRDRGALRRRNRERLGMPAISESEILSNPAAVRQVVMRGPGW